MYGWRGRIGLIVPATNSVAECEFWSVVPEGVSIHVARASAQSQASSGELERLKSFRTSALAAAQELVCVEPDVVVWACTSGSFVGGKAYDDDLRNQLSEVAQVPVVTTSGAVARALQVMRVQRIALATPYPRDVATLAQAYLEDGVDGLQVVHTASIDGCAGAERGRIPASRVYGLGRTADTDDAEALFISCTDLQTFNVIPLLEADLSKPVISSNQATLWATLHELSVEVSAVPGSLRRC